MKVYWQRLIEVICSLSFFICEIKDLLLMFPSILYILNH